MDYKFEEEGGRVKVKEEFTPARRWSFLVGKDEKSHTAQSQFVPILLDDEHNPTLSRLEEAFNIETVTKEFFEKYRELFVKAVDELNEIVRKESKIREDFKYKGVNTVDFAKKLLGQIVFLYFLQKKGWFGVKRDADWGTGPKNFLRELFEEKHGKYNNFFNDILEPLFYEALARERDDDFYSRFNCKIPFLNGGLFEPINNYDWVHTDILLPNELFSNTFKTKEGDIGNGILDIFDRYNFTVKEDEPLEKEVAIDPELLGKAYEKFNAIRPDNYTEYKKALLSGKKDLERQFNKQYGVYYTPREIVHYMCQQSLINYLATEFSFAIQNHSSVIPGEARNLKNDIEILIKYGETAQENEARIEAKGRETDTYYHKLPESIHQNAKLIDEKLANIKVCDPAAGSGAFLVGMMAEIIKARNVLTTFLSLRGAEATKQSCSIYNYKRECIEKSLYGVDIDPGAVEIAKLRLWLSLVVDEEDIKQIKPLPNLDYKIMQGNSVISEFMGINFDTNENNKSMFKDEIDILIEEFKQKKIEFQNEPDRNRKDALKQKIENLIIKIFETKLKKQKSNFFNRLQKIESKYSVLPDEKQRNEIILKEKEKIYKERGFDLETAKKQLREYTSGLKIKPFFLWKLYFAEVSQGENLGFDIVIANPPYGNLLKNGEKDIISKNYIYSTTSDISSPFIEKGVNLLKDKGNLVYIITYAATFNKDFSKSRQLLNDAFEMTEIYSFDRDKCRIFKSMSQSVSIMKCFNKNSKIKNGIFTSRMFRDTPEINQIEVSNCNKYLHPKNATYYNVHRLPKLGEKINVQILTKLLVNKNTAATLIRKSGEKIWIRTSGNYWYNAFDRKPYKSCKFKPLCIDDDYADFLIILMNSSIFYFWFRIYGDGRDMNIDILECFPLPLDKLLLKYKSLTNKMKNRFMDKLFSVFDKTRNRFITSEIKSEIDLLDLILGRYFYNLNYKEITHILNYDSEIRGGNKLQKPFIDLVDTILSIQEQYGYPLSDGASVKVSELETKIDQMVYKLYGLTEEETKIIENFNNK